MGTVSKIMDYLTGSPGEINWEELRGLMEYETNINRTDRMGPFTGWAWDNKMDDQGNIIYDEQGNPMKGNTQTMAINENFQPAVERLGNRATGVDPMITSQMDPRMQGIFDASMNNQMARYGVPPVPPPGSDEPGYG